MIRNNKMLWTLQVLLATLYLFAGMFKVLAAAETLGSPDPLPIWFLRLVGALETAGALGLVLPGLTGVQRRLTPIAAACLIGIMIGAAVVAAITMGALLALFPVLVGVLDAVVFIGRRDWLPQLTASMNRAVAE